ncbi:hypothetical protein GCM10011289_13260 [Paludibacterium paludis]|uniref:Uncharacterized protein n=1 Tax=Paludibacterium paludis TaxID=1225769 RepID=A0A918U940_9NEIS|nr:hypothetical protein GCM10011289_13260 [Paludibacterium paludis]
MANWCAMDEALKASTWDRLPERHCWLRLAGVLNGSLDVVQTEGEEWGRIELFDRSALLVQWRDGIWRVRQEGNQDILQVAEADIQYVDAWIREKP